jgi:hypothetical protein
MGLLHDRAAGKAGVDLTLAAAQDHGGSVWKAERLASMMAFRTDEAAGPSHRLKVFGTGMVIRENTLEFWQTGGKAASVHKEV